MPGFLTAGYHVTSDLPAAIRAAGVRAPGRTDRAGLIAAVADRLRTAGDPADAVVLAAAGSRRRQSVREVGDAARELTRRLGCGVPAS